ncbi:hypothetical protein [Kitasatospora sp. NPDC088134]|uniref:hypothetical protein n=1 Tax=Kitasatospora sp. NPDC088134 TaxID=3364071 RepID=UPI00380215B4
MPPHRRAVPLGTALLLVALTSGCSFGGDEKPVIDLQQARSRIDAVLDGTSGALKPAVGYRDGSYEARVHVDWKQDSDGKALLRKRRDLGPMISPEKAGVLLGQASDYWKAQGYSVKEDPAARNPCSVSATLPDGTQVFIELYDAGNAYIGASVDPVKDPGSTYPFRSEETAHPTVDPTPGPGKQDDPYWSH